LFKARRRRALTIASIWYTMTWLFYIAAAGTSGDNWALYYHCIAVPPACMLIGLGAVALRGRSARSANTRQRPALISPRRFAVVTVLLTLALLAVTTYFRIHSRDNAEDLRRLHDCAMEIDQAIPSNGEIVVRGGRSVDEYGSPVAFNEPMLFAWMDRRGFNYPKDQLSVDKLDDIARRGGRYWIARADELDPNDGHGDLHDRYESIGACRCGALIAFDLDRKAPAARTVRSARSDHDAN
ncbi:MAG: hypothetical protein KDA33_04505, partial [Phycisphaerales bacterium]|nr:hypothetical protein [Phycisphaerales bacterium]